MKQFTFYKLYSDILDGMNDTDAGKFAMRICEYEFEDKLPELKAAKTHTVLYQINRTEYYCQVDLPLSDYPLYGKQLVASRG